MALGGEKKMALKKKEFLLQTDGKRTGIRGPLRRGPRGKEEEKKCEIRLILQTFVLIMKFCCEIWSKLSLINIKNNHHRHHHLSHSHV